MQELERFPIVDGALLPYYESSLIQFYFKLNVTTPSAILYLEFLCYLKYYYLLL